MSNTHATTSRIPTGNWWKNISPYHLVLLAQFFVILPHAGHLPTWLTAYGVMVVISQLMPVKRRLPFGKRSWRFIQLAGFVLGVFGLYLSYRTAFGLDVGISFLLLCLISKLLELFTRRDAYVILSLSFFVLAGLFLMDQGLGSTIQVFVGTLAVFYAMIAHNDGAAAANETYHAALSLSEQNQSNQSITNTQSYPARHHSNDGRLRALGIVSLLAIPLMIVLFLFFPRLPPLWSINLSGANAKTGMSDSMSPGDFASLSRSSELAFRVLFKDNKIPPKPELYWRGMVFSDYDGVTWRASDMANRFAKLYAGSQPQWLTEALHVPKQQPSQYQVIMQPTNQHWLFALDFSFPQPEKVQTSNARQGILLTREFNLESREPVSQRYVYDVDYYQQAQHDITLPDILREDSLRLPPNANPQARQMAQQLFSKMNKDPKAYARAVLAWIRKDNFSYTLSPPPLFEERVDMFLFTTKSGFCEHYASAFTFLMRAAGVPARVVVGYQGGQIGSDGQSWEVRQLDAHAWTEIWLEGMGWQRIDPTAAIAPERVNNGMSELTESRGAAFFGTGAGAQLSYQQYKLLKRMRKAMDYASFIWQRDVVGFDQDAQADSLLKWFNLKNQYQQIMVMFGMMGSMVAAFVTYLWWRRRKVWHPVDKPLVKLSKRMNKHDLARAEDEGVLDWLARVGEATGQVEQAERIAQHYRQLRYADVTESDEWLADYKHMVKQIKLPR